MAYDIYFQQFVLALATTSPPHHNYKKNFVLPAPASTPLTFTLSFLTRFSFYIFRPSIQVRFHLEYSSGTAAVRGTKPLSEGHHYWEILMQSAVYGTDMMVGLGTAAVQMDKYR